MMSYCRITGHALTLENICETDPTTTSASAADESRTLTFAELKDLIEEGKTDQIPNNRYIPEAINVSLNLFDLDLSFSRITFYPRKLLRANHKHRRGRNPGR
jgi:hypothetical protein